MKDDYWKQIGRTYRGKSGKDRTLVAIKNNGCEVHYRKAGTSGVFTPNQCWISTWLSWCKELLPESGIK